MTTAAILDIDGTLVDTNYQHAIAWFRAFRRHRVTPPIWRIHRHIGMGGDQLVRRRGRRGGRAPPWRRIRETEAELYMELIAEVEPLEDARELIADLKSRSDAWCWRAPPSSTRSIATWTCSTPATLADAWTTSADVEETKPEPDLVHAALDRAGADEALMVGDTTWDCEAAAKAGVATVGVLTGGFSEAELLDAGAVAVFESLGPLRAALDRLPVVGHEGGPRPAQPLGKICGVRTRELAGSGLRWRPRHHSRPAPTLRTCAVMRAEGAV